jgi:two-component system, OmpR family, KDP operon response regulator KdpE
MLRRWSLRQVFGKAGDKPPELVENEDSMSGTIESGDFRIDLAQRSVCLRGRELPLTSEEFEVLVFLAGHPQSLVTPRTMLATSGSAQRVRQAEFLKGLISLHSKLDAAADQGKHYIRTEPWVVYRFDPTSFSTT